MKPSRGSRNGSYGQRPTGQRPLEGPLPPYSRPGSPYGRTAQRPYPYGPASPSYPYGRPASPQPGGEVPPPPRIPSGTGDMRRYLAVALDCYLCLLTAGLLIRPYVQSAEAGRAVVLAVLPVLALSFANQVLLTAAVRASAGKLIMGVRVIGLPGVGRPGVWRLVRRWLYGLCRMPLRPWGWLRSLFVRPPGRFEGTLWWNSEGGDPYGDMAGLRQVRRSDLLAYRAAVAEQVV